MRAVYSLTAEDRSEAQRGYYSALSGLRPFYAVTTPLALGAAGLGLYSAQVGPGEVTAWFFAVAVLLLLVRPFVRWFRSARRFPDGTLEIETSEQGLLITSAQGRWETPWTAFRKFYETRNLFLLSYASAAFYVVPKRALAGPDCDVFRQLISAKIRHARGNAELRIVRTLTAFALLSLILFAFFGGTIQLAVERVTNFLATAAPQTSARYKPVKEQVATRAQLHGRGAIYFVPIGGAAQLLHPSLVQYYLQKYGLTVELLPAIPLSAWAEDHARHQVVAEELTEAIRRAYPAQSKEQDAILVGVTDQDLCIGEYDWEFSFNFRQSKRIAVVSAARLTTDSHGSVATPELVETRLRKLLTKNIGVLYYHLDPSSEPTSVLYSDVQDANILDAMGEDYLLRDVQYADSDDEDDDDDSGWYSGGDPCLTLRHHYDTSRQRTDFAYLSGCGKFHGDPEVETLDLDLRYGMVILRRTDFYLGGRFPLQLSRALRTQDEGSRAFGIGGNHSLNLWPVGNRWPFTWIDLIFEDGGRAHYKRTNWGIAYWDAVYRDYADTGSDWYGSAIRWNWPGFALTREDGSTYYFPDGDRVQRSEQAALIGVRNKWGETLKLERESHGNLVRAISSTGPWLKLSYDAQNRVIEGQDSEGHTASYRYNQAGYLEQVVDSDNRTIHYFYDGGNRLSQVAVNGHTILNHEFDASGRISKLTIGDSEIYSFDYVVSGGAITQVDITDPADNRWHISLSKGGYTLEQLRSGNPKSSAQALIQ